MKIMKKTKNIEGVKWEIGELCHLEKGRQIDTELLNNDNKYPYINGGIEPSGFYTDYNTPGQTITISEGGASCGYVNFVEENFWCGCHCYRLTNIQMIPKYVFYALKANQDKLMALRTGSAMPNIKKSSLEKFEITLCEDEVFQRKVVQALDKVVTLIESRKQQLEKLDELIKARFVEMFGDVEGNPYDIPTRDMTSVCEIIDGDRGVNYPKQDEFSDSGYCLFLNAKNVTAEGFVFENCLFISKEKDIALRKGKLQRGDVVLTTRGTIGNLAYYSSSIPFDNIRINSGMVILRMRHNIISEIFSLNNSS